MNTRGGGARAASTRKSTSTSKCHWIYVYQWRRNACRNADRPSIAIRMLTVSPAHGAKKMNVEMKPPHVAPNIWMPRPRSTIVHSTSDSSLYTYETSLLKQWGDNTSMSDSMNVLDSISHTRVRETQCPKTQVGCSVWDGAQAVLDRMDRLQHYYVHRILHQKGKHKHNSTVYSIRDMRVNKNESPSTVHRPNSRLSQRHTKEITEKIKEILNIVYRYRNGANW